MPTKPYRVMGFFQGANFPNGLVVQEILFWTADYFKGVCCVAI